MSRSELSSDCESERLVALRELWRREPAESRLPGRNSTKADILVYRVDGKRVAVKDYRRRSFAIRTTLGRLQISRECRAYRALRGIAGIPGYLGRLGPYSMALEWVEGRPLAEYGLGSLTGEVFDRLDAIVERIHRRGVALVDLHHRDVLLDESGEVHLLDLAAARVGPTDRQRRGLLQRRLQRLDRLELVRLRTRFTGGDVEAAMQAADPGLAGWHRRGRRLKAAWDRLRGRN